VPTKSARTRRATVIAQGPQQHVGRGVRGFRDGLARLAMRSRTPSGSCQRLNQSRDEETRRALLVPGNEAASQEGTKPIPRRRETQQVLGLAARGAGPVGHDPPPRPTASGENASPFPELAEPGRRRAEPVVGEQGENTSGCASRYRKSGDGIARAPAAHKRARVIAQSFVNCDPCRAGQDEQASTRP